MNPNPHNSMHAGAAHGSAEETLRLIASLPAPEGLAERVQQALRAAPHTSRVLSWPAALQPQSAWMRAVAAAAIVFVVAGGGWGVYAHVQQGQPGKGIVLPVRGPEGAGFSSAGAMRTPQTLNGPTIMQPAKQQQAKAKPVKKRMAHGGAHTAYPAAVHPATPAAK